MAEKAPARSWKMPGCRGRFYVRGKQNIIYYESGDRPRSMRLIYTRKNRQISGLLIAQEENSTIFVPEDQRAPRLISGAMEEHAEYVLQNLSPQSIEAYRSAMKKLITEDLFLQDTVKITRHINENITNSKISKRTAKSYLGLARAFFSFCLEREWIDKNPISGKYFNIKTPDKLIDIWEPWELEKIFTYWRGRDTHFYLLIMFLYKTAFRISEALSLKQYQCRQGDAWRKEIILPSSKYGDRSETFPLAPVVRELLEAADRFILDDKYFEFHISRNGLGTRFVKGLQEMNIRHTMPGNGYGRSFHTFRKTRISEWIVKDKLDVYAVTKLSRDNIGTVMKYYAKLRTDDFSKYVT